VNQNKCNGLIVLNPEPLYYVVLLMPANNPQTSGSGSSGARLPVIRFEEEMHNLVSAASELIEQEKEFAVVMVLRSQGSSAVKTGAKAIVLPEGRIIGWLGGWCSENAVLTAALEALEKGTPKIVRLVMKGDELRKIGEDVIEVGTPCGGEVDIYIEPVYPRLQLLLVGDNEVTRMLAKIGKILGYKIAVYDMMATKEKYPEADIIINSPSSLEKIRIDRNTIAILATMGKTWVDEETLERLLKTDIGLIELVSSTRRAQEVLKLLIKKGYKPEDLRRIVTPAGIDIGAISPGEIAISVLAEIIMFRRGGSGKSMREVKGDPLEIVLSAIESPALSRPEQ
jgi:xanthine dehydrogenase accessory factor